MHLLDRDLELDVLGVVICDEKARWELLSTLNPDTFGDPKHGRLWRKIQSMAAEGAKISHIEVSKLAGAEHLETVGLAYERYRGTANLDKKMERLEGLAQARKCVEATRHAMARLRDQHDPKAVISEHAQDLMSLVTNSVGNRVYGPEDWVKVAWEEAEKRYDEVQQGGQPYLDLGFPNFSRRAAVLPQNLVFVCAQTKAKKSMLMLNIAIHLGCNLRIPTLYCNTEMSIAELSLRAASMVAPARNYDLRTGGNIEEVNKLLKWAERGTMNKLYLTDSLHSLTSTDVVNLARQHKHQHGVQVVILDYIQRLRDGDKSEDDDWQALIKATARLKSMAQELDLYVFAVAQLAEHGGLQRAKYMKNEIDAMWTFSQSETHKNVYEIEIVAARHVEDGVYQDLSWDSSTLQFREV